MEESPAKRMKVEAQDSPARRIKVETEEVPRDDMINAIFRSWDRDGNGTVELEEIIPHYMKSANHQEDQEHEVRAKFTKFMAAHGKGPAEGIDMDIFRKWLGKLDDVKLSKHYERHVLGKSDGPYRLNINKAVIKEFEGKSLKEILDAPISAIQGLGDAVVAPMEELGLKTVRDVGTWRFYLLARAIVTLAEKEDAHSPCGTTSGLLWDSSTSHMMMNIKNAMDREHERKTLKEVLKLHPAAFNMFPAKASEFLSALKISTIEKLGLRKTFSWANAMVELEKYEAHAPE